VALEVYDHRRRSNGELETAELPQTSPSSEEERSVASPEDIYQCQTVSCGYLYDPDRGDRKGKIPKGVKFEDLPEDWKCPVCGAGKKMFRPLRGPGSVAEGE
jgi:rubredoxin